jgi:molecular chaperone GrpE
MSEPTPPSLVADAADGAAEALNEGTIDRLLADFRAWLGEPHRISDPVPAEPPFDLSALLAPFVALRHEVNLQTKASRAQLEQNAQALEQLRLALDAVRRPPSPPADDLLRPLLKTLIDVHDALSLAQREVLRVRDGSPAESVAPPELRLPFWLRWLGLQERIDREMASLRERNARAQAQEAARLRHQADALLVGYDMSLQRLGRTLDQHGVERVACVNEPFDPETMEVAEVVRDPARTATEVIGELRPGYRWRGKLLRYAQVRVARP